jgi:hypothetical protein
MSSSRQRGMSKNQIKKQAEQKSEMQSLKGLTISTDFDFTNTAVVFIEKNNGFCFEGKVVFTKSSKKYDTNVKVMHARGRGGRHAFMNSRSKLGLVSLTSITLPHGSIGTVEEWITPSHLNVYLKNGLINDDDHAKFNNLIGRTGIENEEDDQGGFIFDESAGVNQNAGGADNDREISIDDI